jgi:hypothetical protein
VTRQRTLAEQYLLDSISTVPSSVGCHGTSFRLQQAAGHATPISHLELLRAALHPPDYLLRFNPFLSQQSCQHLYQGLLLWLQLCVLEDRLGRLQRLSQAVGRSEGVLPLLIQELSIRRTWDVQKHPWWLVFEVEGQFQVSLLGM